jgi:heme exporter protein D
MADWIRWHDIDAFLAMGGYGLYVWGAYGLAAAALGLEGWLAHRRAQRAWRATRLPARRAADA